MYDGYKKIFWGLFFSTFHINLGVLQILPAFVGWLIVADGINILYNETSNISLKKAYNVTLIVAGVSFVGFLSAITGGAFNIITYVSLLTPFIVLIFTYYLITGSIDYMRLIGEEEAAVRYEGSLRIYLVIYIINTLAGMILYTIGDSYWLTICTIIGIIQVIWLMFIVKSLKSMQPPQEEERLNETEE